MPRHHGWVVVQVPSSEGSRQHRKRRRSRGLPRSMPWGWPWLITRSIRPVNWSLSRPAASVHYAFWCGDWSWWYGYVYVATDLYVLYILVSCIVWKGTGPWPWSKYGCRML
jgi:hypothetical protein